MTWRDRDDCAGRELAFDGGQVGDEKRGLFPWGEGVGRSEEHGRRRVTFAECQDGGDVAVGGDDR